MYIDESTILDEDYYDEKLALAYLLVNDIVFLNVVDISKEFSKFYKEETWTTCIYVNCNDTFYYASADSEIISLYKMCKENLRFGLVNSIIKSEHF
jgi:hypothetical protein